MPPRLKRIRMRAWRRGTRECDLILGRFADRELAALGEDEIGVFEALLEEPDPDIYAWVAGREPPPVRYRDLVARLAREAGGL